MLFGNHDILPKVYQRVVLFIFLVGSCSNQKPNNDNNVEKNEPIHNKNMTMENKSILLEDNLFLSLVANNTFQINDSNFHPVHIISYLDGFSGGLKWKQKMASMSRGLNQKIELHITGVMEWHLIGFRIYSQTKDFTLKMDVDD